MSETTPEPPVPYAGCLWPVDAGCLSDRWDQIDPNIRERAVALASATLRRLTGYRVGGCPVTVRPCSPRAYDIAFIPFRGSYGSDWISPGVNSSGLWVNACGCSATCACSTTCEVRLPAPVGEVIEVKVDGQVVSPAQYRVEDGNRLTWRGEGECPFPATQDLSLSDDQPGTFSITYLNAHPVDMLGAQAAAYLAMEFVKACVGSGKCSLPRNVTEVVRNGVSFTIEAGLFPQGRTGIDIVDAYVELWNPDHRVAPSTVWTPGGSRMRSV